ncbi:hypothetical protein CkaCkLH20_07816 [Colletotrichum karsti]|uniref:Oxidoreductase AflY n=1 Tax=Colletotrichum karsti TaxID=1095194 RepID=A0A9P6LG03_9PEZI|nr:uncharacterized protein CkaCkLH20_07816 [Colletotrichum karsti]KAF9874679.1 hypothetical protein CkaCkLH20_07816 [Colletotrichum karsti]
MNLTFQPILRQPPPPGATNPAWDVVQELLQLNHDKFDVYFQSVHQVLMHNHLAHHALTLYSLGATAETIRSHFKGHEGYQKDKGAEDVFFVHTISNLGAFKRALGNPDQYHNFLELFRLRFKWDGYTDALNRLLFSGDEWSTEIFSRMVTGYIHPLIQTGFGLEFDLPFLVCEGLAMACTQNDEEVATAMLEIEERASGREDRLNLVEILDACAADKKLVDSLHQDMFHVIDSEGLLGTSKVDVIEHASRFTVLESEIQLKSAELCNSTSYLMAGAQRLGKEPRADFFLLHTTNCSILVDSIVQKDWIGRQGKARLLSWFGRYSIMLYIAMGCPKLDLSVVRTYKPRKGPGGWADAIERGLNYKDDGHGCKIIRALIHAQDVSRPYENRPEFRVKQDDFVKAATAVAESWSLEDPVGRAGHDRKEAWIRFAGFDRAWDDVPSLEPGEG